jgi:DNA-directed RNA polymerase
MQARDAPPEVKPVMTVSSTTNPILSCADQQSAGKTFSRKKPVDTENTPDEARFAVSNLRKNLEKIASPSIPVNRQRDLEHASYDAAQAELEQASRMMKDGNVSDNQALQQGRLQSWMHDWYRALTVKLREDIAAMQQKVDEKEFNVQQYKSTLSTGMKDPAILLYLTLLPVEKLALITVLEVMRMAGSGGITDGMKALRGMLSVGRAVETEYRADTIKNVSGVDSPQWLRTIDPTTQRPSRALVTQVWQRLGHQVKEGKQGSSSNDPTAEADWRSVWTPSWPQSTHVGVGSVLIEALLSVAKVTRKARDPETGETV